MTTIKFLISKHDYAIQLDRLLLSEHVKQNVSIQEWNRFMHYCYQVYGKQDLNCVDITQEALLGEGEYIDNNYLQLVVYNTAHRTYESFKFQDVESMEAA